jgi:hypothetical protein
MPRRARVRYAGVPQHVIQRGNNRAACFFADENYQSYLDSLFIIPTLCVGMQAEPLLRFGRRASLSGFPRRAWEP